MKPGDDRIACSVTDFFDAPLHQAARIVSEAGFPAIELFLGRGPLRGGMDACPPARVTSGLANHGLFVSSLNIGNLTAEDPAEGLAEAEARLREVGYARSLGLMSANLKGGARHQQSLVALACGLLDICKGLPEGMTLNLGNHHGNRVQDAGDLRAILAETPESVRVLLDTGHFLSAGVDPVAIAEEFGPRIGLVHLRDQVGDRPVAFGTGDLRFEDLFRCLADVGYDGWYVIEIEHLSEPEDIVERQRVAREFVAAGLALR